MKGRSKKKLTLKSGHRKKRNPGNSFSTDDVCSHAAGRRRVGPRVAGLSAGHDARVAPAAAREQEVLRRVEPVPRAGDGLAGRIPGGQG